MAINFQESLAKPNGSLPKWQGPEGPVFSGGDETARQDRRFPPQEMDETQKSRHLEPQPVQGKVLEILPDRSQDTFLGGLFTRSVIGLPRSIPSQQEKLPGT